MTPSALYDIFQKKFKDAIHADLFVKSFKQDKNNRNGIYLNTKIGNLYFHYDPRKDTWMLTNDVSIKNKLLRKSDESQK